MANVISSSHLPGRSAQGVDFCNRALAGASSVSGAHLSQACPVSPAGQVEMGVVAQPFGAASVQKFRYSGGERSVLKHHSEINHKRLILFCQNFKGV